VVQLLARMPNVDRMLLAAASIDDLLSSLGLDGAQRLEWLRLCATARKEVGDEYRARRARLTEVLQDPGTLDAQFVAILEKRREQLRPVTEGLRGLEAAGVLSQPWRALVSSFVHMHCNRLGFDQTAEARCLGLLARAREAMAHIPLGKEAREHADS